MAVKIIYVYAMHTTHTDINKSVFEREKSAHKDDCQVQLHKHRKKERKPVFVSIVFIIGILDNCVKNFAMGTLQFSEIYITFASTKHLYI